MSRAAGGGRDRHRSVLAATTRPIGERERPESAWVLVSRRGARGIVAQAAMEEARPTKTCPDCAEQVLIAARKCRFCGYRFDTPTEPQSPSRAEGLLGIIFRLERAPQTMSQLLANWGIEQDVGEQEAALFCGSIGGSPGFIVVTETRFCFVPSSRSARQRVLDEHLLRDLLRVHIRRYRVRRALFIEWRDTRTIVEAGANELKSLQARLAPHALA